MALKENEIKALRRLGDIRVFDGDSWFSVGDLIDYALVLEARLEKLGEAACSSDLRRSGSFPTSLGHSFGSMKTETWE